MLRIMDVTIRYAESEKQNIKVEIALVLDRHGFMNKLLAIINYINKEAK